MKLRKDDFYKCPNCDGIGYTVELDHGVLGEPCTYTKPCNHCQYGICISTKVVNKLKKKVGI